jgi:hypothetical protein
MDSIVLPSMVIEAGFFQSIERFRLAEAGKNRLFALVAGILRNTPYDP